MDFHLSRLPARKKSVLFLEKAIIGLSQEKVDFGKYLIQKYYFGELEFLDVFLFISLPPVLRTGKSERGKKPPKK